MAQLFATSWKASKKPSKQRAYRKNAPLHIKRKLLRAHLSKELRSMYRIRALPVVVGDTVAVLKGAFKGKTGKVNSVDAGQAAVYIDGVEEVRKDGTKAFKPVQAANLVITELELKDRRRAEKLR